MLDKLSAVPPDPILGIISAHAADPSPKKIDLGIGVYRNEDGGTPILKCVKEAEKILNSTETTKSYLGPPGVAGFNSAMTDLIFGEDSAVNSEQRVHTIQTPGGTGALRLGADLIKAAAPDATVWASDPTWANHDAIFPAAGLRLENYPYFDRQKSDLRFDAMMESLRSKGPGDVVLFHACCHNPCGVSPNEDQWREITDLTAEKGFLPMIDLAYMGFERGIEEDTVSVRLFTEKCPEVLVASSCSKNFAVYRERVGAISAVCDNPQKASDVVTVINSLTRKNYSMPPTHGTGIIDIILHSDELTALWREEVADMRNRINGLRNILSEKIANAGIERDFSFLQRQSGMFSFLGLSVDQVRRLREEFSIYTVDSARVNIASFNDSNMDYFVDALKTVL
ncbi:MAG: aspartate/tyrosine/aromatic aminotransferase [Xanthomonadales bacterium]|nr:aspartate/tyrosine/aromatic aminotransferase [Gammaproteobacteria bacterium]NNK51154.1 aspartate/tyrosine/aromatic aminotransferase [Xanthomonadales bacterium]